MGHHVGYQKEIALKTLAVEHVRQELGLNVDDVRHARLDSHAGRFRELTGDALLNVATRCRDLFDVSALLQALAAEINGFSAESQPESLPCLFVTWAAANLSQPHAIFSASDPYRLDVDESLVLACLEQLFLGYVNAPDEEQYHERNVKKLFEVHHCDENDVVACDHKCVASEAARSATQTMDITPKRGFTSMKLISIVGVIALSFWASRLTQ